MKWNKIMLILTLRSHELMRGGGNCSIAGGAQFSRSGLKVGTPCLFNLEEFRVVGVVEGKSLVCCC